MVLRDLQHDDLEISALRFSYMSPYRRPENSLLKLSLSPRGETLR